MILPNRPTRQTRRSIEKKVLLVENNIICVAHVEAVMQKWKITVDAVQNSKEAIQKLISQTYDGILIDIEMLQSLEEINVIRSAHWIRDVFIVVILAEQMPQSKLESYGIKGVILKPCSTTELEKFSIYINSF